MRPASTDQNRSGLPSVLLIGPLPPPRGGISIHLDRLSRALKRKGIPFEILNESRRLNEQGRSLRTIAPPIYVRMLRQADVVHIHTGNPALRLFHAIAARLCGARTLITLHSHKKMTGAGRVFRDLLVRAACRVADGTIAVSQEIARKTGVEATIVPAYIEPSTDEEIVSDDVAAWIEQQKQSGRTVISMNASNTAKIEGVDLYGCDLLIDALSPPAGLDDFSAIICISTTGPDATYLSDLRSRVLDRNLQSRVWLRHSDTSFAGILRESDVFVRPTITDGDSLSVREALSYGVPTVASNAAERPEGTKVFRSRDLDHFTQCVREAANDVAPRQLHRAEFVEDILSVYRTLASRR